MDVVEAPEKWHTVVQPMPTEHSVIEDEDRDDAGEQWRQRNHAD
jgi:hypothetical protein